MNGQTIMKGLNLINPRYINEAEFDSIEEEGRAASVQKRRIPKLWLIAALIGTMLLLMGAAAFTRWSTSMQTRYNPSEVIKQQAEDSGLSVLLEDGDGTGNPNEVLCVTDQGITITAVQTIVDEYSAELTFRVEGFELPEGSVPAAWPLVTIDGKDDFYWGQTGSFFDGITRDEKGNLVYLDGNPVQTDASGCFISRYSANDGSMEYTHHIGFQETDGRYFGKEIVVTFPYIGLQSTQNAGQDERTVEGNWTLRWTLTGTENKITIAPNAQIGDSGVVLLDAEIGQRSIRTRYHVADLWEGWDELVDLPQEVCGVRMNDGSVHLCLAATSGFEDQDSMIYFAESNFYDSILDISQVEALLFHKGWEKDSAGERTIETFYEIPIK